MCCLLAHPCDVKLYICWTKLLTTVLGNSHARLVRRPASQPASQPTAHRPAAPDRVTPAGDCVRDPGGGRDRGGGRGRDITEDDIQLHDTSGGSPGLARNYRLQNCFYCQVAVQSPGVNSVPLLLSLTGTALLLGLESLDTFSYQAGSSRKIK